MQIVIDINEETYEYMTPKEPREMTNKNAAEWFVVLHKAIFVNGKVLPKGHGRLIDADALASEYSEFSLPEYVIEPYVNAPTIIEADKEGAEE